MSLWLMWPYQISSTHFYVCTPSVRVHVRSDTSLYRQFNYNTHTNTCTHVHTAKTDSHSQQWLQAQMWKTTTFFFPSFAFFYMCIFLVSTKWLNYRGLYLARYWDATHTLPRRARVQQRRPENQHKWNRGFVPNCYTFSISHGSKLLDVWGTFVMRDCLSLWAIIFLMCHSQRDGTVLHMLCKQALSRKLNYLNSVASPPCFWRLVGKNAVKVWTVKWFRTRRHSLPEAGPAHAPIWGFGIEGFEPPPPYV